MLDGIPKPMFSREVATRLGMALDTFYKNRPRLHAEDGMPPSLTRHRPFRFNRVKMEAWFNRDRDLPAPANDLVPPQQPADVAQHQALLARAYGRYA